jgi:hypothetical protein
MNVSQNGIIHQIELRKEEALGAWRGTAMGMSGTWRLLTVRDEGTTGKAGKKGFASEKGMNGGAINEIWLIHTLIVRHIDAALYGLAPPKVTTLYAVSVPKGKEQVCRYDDGTGDELKVPLGGTACTFSF